MSGTLHERQDFDVPLGQHLLSSFLHATRHLWRRLGAMESKALQDQLDSIALDRPIYITGLARSGSTILLEMIAAHEDVATHRYHDFWSIFTPVWAAQATQRMHQADIPPVERAHGDGILITPQSPEAMEEMVWMEFFADLHDPRISNVLGVQTENPRFERFYKDHLRKMLLVRKANRYASKANYNLTRLAYLLKLFPDARFVLPVRHPRDQIASLQKQHRLLTDSARQYPRSVKYLDRVGHFEFGAHRTPINAGDSRAIAEIIQLWEKGEDVRGWARYWAHLHRFLADQLERNNAVREAAIVVPYDDLCSDSNVVLAQLFAHCELDSAEHLIERFAPRLQRPRYYQPCFSSAEERIIERETADVLDRVFSTSHAAAQPSGSMAASC